MKDKILTVARLCIYRNCLNNWVLTLDFRSWNEEKNEVECHTDFNRTYANISYKVDLTEDGGREYQHSFGDIFFNHTLARTQDVQEAAKVMAKLEKALEKTRERLGRPGSIGQIVVQLMIALKLDGVIVDLAGNDRLYKTGVDVDCAVTNALAWKFPEKAA